MTARSPFEEAQAIRVLANAGLPEPARQKAGLAFMKHMLQQGHGIGQLTELARKITAITGDRPPETAFTLRPHRYTSQEIEHFEQIRETIHEILRPGITARQAQWDRERAQRSVKKTDLSNIFDEMLAEIGNPDYGADVLMKSNVQAAVQAARNAQQQEKRRRQT